MSTVFTEIQMEKKLVLSSPKMYEENSYMQEPDPGQLWPRVTHFLQEKRPLLLVRLSIIAWAHGRQGSLTQGFVFGLRQPLCPHRT